MRVGLESQGSWPLCESTLSENGYEEKGKNIAQIELLMTGPGKRQCD